MNSKFDDIRPYFDEEIPAAMQRIAKSNSFPLISTFVFPEERVDDIRKMILGYKTIKDFQYGVMYHANEQIISKSISQLSVGGIEHLSPDNHYLFVSNHRDIMLDASLLQNILVDNGFETTEITFGANLMINQLVIDIGKSNKMFRVDRPHGTIRDFYHSSRHLSEYLRWTICQNNHSVWIAQRNGRTKDGHDATDQGIIKMFCFSQEGDKIRALSDLHIVPISVSYEWESCDILKALELYESRSVKYTKKPGEDLNSILTGITQHKGRVHFEICKPIEETELRQFESLTKNEYHKAVAELIDSRIIPAYRLYPNNYIAYDLLYGCKRFSNRYSQEEKECFLNYMKKLEKYDNLDMDVLCEIFLNIYANPVKIKK